ncbi:VOC family protein [Nocardiopsis prasina]|uniref:VOC family protein n=1 Tax=Nocardiopsis prasina TaxID=2015 RepID=UPI001EF9E882|nr:VOC family protein [Nocardiopsis prasina]
MLRDITDAEPDERTTMTTNPFEIALPIADRWRAMVFYREAFGFEALGEPAEDGAPEPLRIRVDDHAVLTLIPADGLAWVLGETRQVARPGTSECLMTRVVPTEADVDALLDRVREAGGEVVNAAERRPWGYDGVCADPDGHLWQVTVQS